MCYFGDLSDVYIKVWLFPILSNVRRGSKELTKELLSDMF